MQQKIDELNRLLKELPEDEIDNILRSLKGGVKDSAKETVNGTREGKIRNILEKIKKSKSAFEFLRVMEGDTMGLSFDIYKTLISIGIKDEDMEKSQDLEDLRPENNHSIENYQTNYKRWLGRKLFLSEKEIQEKSVEDIDNLSTQYIMDAINHVNKYLDNFSEDTRKLLKSQYYQEIHNGEGKKTLFGLLKFWYSLKKREAQIRYESKNSKRPGINYENVLEEVKMGLFEIQRILAIAILYIDREKNQNFQHTSEDTDFVTKKLEKIVAIEMLKDGNLGSENPLYHMTDTKRFEWSKVGSTYEIKEIEEIGPNSKRTITMDGIVFKGRERPYEEELTQIDLLHIGSRMKKGAFSAVDKFIRKGLSTFNEILDHKGFIMVVKDFEEGKKLLRVLENELGTVETSWIEEPVFMDQGGNQNTNTSYNSIKAIIKVPYKGKFIRDFFQSIEEVLKSNSRLKKEMDRLRRKGKSLNEETYQILEPLIEEEARNNQTLRNMFNRLKGKFGKKEYNVEIEIQIFDMQNYFKAEIDKESPAHHDHYKRKQILDGLGYYFPSKIYKDNRLMRAISEIVK